MATPAPLAPGLARKIKKLLAVRVSSSAPVVSDAVQRNGNGNALRGDGQGQGQGGGGGGGGVVKTDGDALYAALEALGVFLESSGEGEKQLGNGLLRAVEARAAKSTRAFVKASDACVASLTELDAELETLEALVATLTAKIAASSGAADVVSETETLTAAMQRSEKREAIVEEFLKEFTLTTAEVEALTGSDAHGESTQTAANSATTAAGGPGETRLGSAFFDALDRVRTIHAGCRRLLRTPQHQRAGLELMQHMSGYQEAAYDRLCRWVQAELRSLGDGSAAGTDADAPVEVDTALRRGVRALRTRPVLYSYCLEEMAIARHNALFRRFIGALTRGGVGPSGARPIEIHAHDPRRYIGDMLAWIHQALANEKDVVLQVLASDDDDDNDNASASTRGGGTSKPDASSAEGTVNDNEQEDAVGVMCTQFGILDKVFESVCRPFRVRVDQVLASQPGAALLLKISSLLSFMASTMAPAFGARPAAAASAGGARVEPCIVSTIRECASLARAGFQEKVRGTGERLIRSPPAAPPDLGAPQQLLDGLAQLESLLNSTIADIAPADDDDDPKSNPGFVLDAFVDPMLEFCVRSADALAKARASAPVAVKSSAADAKVYLLNCYLTILDTVKKYSFTGASAKADDVQALTDSTITDIVDAEVGALLASDACRVAGPIAIIRAHEEARAADASPAPLSEDPEMSLSALIDCLQRIFEFAAMSTLPELLLIKQPRARTVAKDGIAKGILDAYAVIYGAIRDKANGYADPSLSLKHNPEHLNTVLGV